MNRELAVHVDLADLVCRPIAHLCERWKKDEKTLQKWARKNWIPGAFKMPNGEWFYYPAKLVGFDLTVVLKLDSQTGETEEIPSKSKGRGNGSSQGNEVPGETKDAWQDRVRHPAGNLRAG